MFADAPGTPPIGAAPAPCSKVTISDRARGPLSLPSYSSKVDSISVKSILTSTSERTFPIPTTGVRKASILFR